MINYQPASRNSSGFTKPATSTQQKSRLDLSQNSGFRTSYAKKLNFSQEQSAVAH